MLKFTEFIFDYTDFDFLALPIVVLAAYTGILLNAIDSTKNPPSDLASSTIIMHDWIRLESFLYVSNVVGIVVFMFLKSILSRLSQKVKHSIQDKKCSSLTDALSRHFWDSFVMQWAVNNFLVSLFVFYQKDYNFDPTESRQYWQIIINIVAGACQTFSILQLFGVSLCPMKRTSLEVRLNLLIKMRTWGQIVLSIAGMFILPVVAFVWAMAMYDVYSIWFYWNIVCFGNSLILTFTVQKETLREMIVLALNPDIDLADNKTRPSIAVKECPTRKFKVGHDIYSFCWFLCQKKKILRKGALLESEVPSSYQAQQVYLTMLFSGLSQILISVTIWIELPNSKIEYEAKWYVQLVRFITLSLIHFQFANEYGLAVKCMKYIALHEKRFKYPFRAFLSSSI